VTAGLGARFAALGAGEVVARLTAFALTIVLAHRLGPAAYGIIGVVMAVMLYLTQVADLGIELVGVPLVARERADVGALASPLLTWRLVVALALTALVVPVGLWLLPQPDGMLLALSAFALPCTALGVRWILLGLDRTAPIALARVTGEAVALGGVLWLVHGEADLARVPLAQVTGAAVTMLLLHGAVRRAGVRLRPRLDGDVAREVFARSRHLMLFTLLGLVLFNLDLIVLRAVRGAEPAGHYAAAYTLIAFCANLFVAFSQAAIAGLARASDPRERGDAYALVAAQAFAVAVPIAIGGTIVAPDLVALVFGERFAPAVTALRILLWSIPAAALREVATAGLIVARRERELLGVNSSSVVANLVLIAVLIPWLGLEGAAIATLVTELVRLAIVVARARGAQLAVPPARLWRAPVAGAAMGGVLLAGGFRSAFVAIPVGAVVYALALVALGGVRFSSGRAPELRP
jgi:O-antigen/teichoic acid export membrane protein